MIEELRAYVPHEGKAEALRTRFLDKVRPIFARLGIELVATYSNPAEPEETWYLTRFADMTTRDALWDRFKTDEEWLAIKAASETDGPLLKEQRISVLEVL